MSRCTGHCCRLFFQARSPIEWAHRGRRAAAVVRRWGDKADKAWCDEVYIANMLVFLREQTHGVSLRGRHQHPVKGGRWYYYTCRHFDGANCTDYENRPRMCSEYLHYGKDNACQYPQCTWKDGKYPQAKDVKGTRVSIVEDEECRMPCRA